MTEGHGDRQRPIHTPSGHSVEVSETAQGRYESRPVLPCWFLGGGYEYALSGLIPLNGLYWRTEYRFAQYQSANVPVVLSTTGVGIGVSEHMQKFTQTITSGLVWRFNFGGPVAARY